MENKICNKVFIFIMVFLFSGLNLFSQQIQDSRYDAGMNLPFNQKCGNVNPQTGNMTLSFTDLRLPGRSGFDFSFGRIWSLNQSNVFHMYRDPVDGSNGLNCNTIEQSNHLGAGWNCTIPYITEDISSGNLVKNLFYGGRVYELDQTGLAVYNTSKSNILGYDLLDLRIYSGAAGSGVCYGDCVTGIPEGMVIIDHITDRSAYVLLLKDNSKVYFRPDGKVMMEQDKTGYNRIWYFYMQDESDNTRLRLVVDTIGRHILFAYTPEGNLESISWEARKGVMNDDGTREMKTETNVIRYSYESGEYYPGIDRLKNFIYEGYKTPYILLSFKDTMGYVTKYEYEEGLVSFTFDDTKSHSENVYLMMTGITEKYSDTTGQYKNKRVFEYMVPAKGMYTRWFYSGYMEYYKISRQYYLDRHFKIMNDTEYVYHDIGEDGNYSYYSTVIKTGNISATYTYSLSDIANMQNVLDTLLTESEDGFREYRDFTYDNNRTKTQEDVYRLGKWVYTEKTIFDKKGNLKWSEDRAGLVTITDYDEKFSIPVKQTKRVTVKGINRNYETETIIDKNLGLILKQIVYLDSGGTKTPIVTSFTYDTYGNIVSSTDPAGNTIHIIYDTETYAFPIKTYQDVSIDSWPSPGSVHDNWLSGPSGRKQVRIRSWKVYNSDGSLWLEIDNEGFALEHYYDKIGREIKTIQPDSNDIRDFAEPLDIDSSGNPVAGDFDDFMQSEYYQDFLFSRQDNPGIYIEIDDENDFIRTITDIDKQSGLVKIAGKQGDGLGNIEEEIEYGSDGSVFGVKSMTYDNMGRMIALTDPDRTDNFTEVEIHGTRVERYDKTWLVKYDDLGRKKLVVYPETAPGKVHVKQITYDDLENSITTIDPEGRKVREQKDWSGNTIRIIGYGNSKTPEQDRQVYVFQYDELNRKTEFTDSLGNKFEYLYNETGNLVEEYYATDGGFELMEYDFRGLLIKKTDRKKQLIIYDYDEMSRNTLVSSYGSETDYMNNIKEDEIRITYDNRANAVRIENSHLIEHYIYDHANRVQRLERRLKDQELRQQIASRIPGGEPESQVFSFSYTYNDAGMVTNMHYPDNSETNYEYESFLGKLTAIRDGFNDFVNEIQYNKAGVVKRMEYNNNTYEAWEFDNRKRIRGIDIGLHNGSMITSMQYSLDGSGNILSINDNTYEYDGFGRITGAKTLIPGNKDLQKIVENDFGTYEGANPLSIEGSMRTYNPAADLNGDGRINGDDLVKASFVSEEDIYDNESFSYDTNGNRILLVQNGDNYRYEYGPENRLENVYKSKNGESGETLYIEFTYDPNGNTVKRTIYPATGDPAETIFEYDVFNRVVKSINQEGTTEYRYDNAGNRFIKKGTGSTTVYLRHGQTAVAMDIEIPDETTEKKGRINRYVLSGELLAGRITTIVKPDDTVETNVSYYHLDHLNSTKCVTDTDGRADVIYEYRAFGEQLKRLDRGGNPAFDSAKYSYGGKELDAATNLYYFNARYYDASIGRFISVDPVKDGHNWYVYCGNNPLSFMDPTGLAEVTEQDKGKNDRLYFDPTVSMGVSGEGKFFIGPFGTVELLKDGNGNFGIGFFGGLKLSEVPSAGVSLQQSVRTHQNMYSVATPELTACLVLADGLGLGICGNYSPPMDEDGLNDYIDLDKAILESNFGLTFTESVQTPEGGLTVAGDAGFVAGINGNILLSDMINGGKWLLGMSSELTLDNPFGAAGPLGGRYGAARTQPDDGFFRRIDKLVDHFFREEKEYE